TRKFGDHVEVLKAVVPGENIIYAGSDIMCGELIARKGTKLSHREIGVLAACGIKEVNVFRRPKVAVISTGNELVEVGSKLEYGKIYDVNSYMLSAAVRENGGEAILLGIARDDESEILEKIKKGLEIADIVITSGSTSAGVGDIMYRILNSFKPGVLVHGIAVKPGKPTIVAFNNGKPIIALPGYPTSAMTVFELLVAPIIRRLSGLHEEERRKLKAKLSLKVFSAEGRRELLPIYIVEGNKKDEFFAYPVSGHYSGAVSTLAFADGFIEIDEDTLVINEGEEVEVNLYSSIKPADLIVIGSQCVGLELLLSILRERKGLNTKIINVGSIGGIKAARSGEADIAGIHIIDEKNEYNLSVAKKFGFTGYLIKGYIREQGLVVKKGNPKGIRDFEDLLREDVVFVNRNRGSGTRILIDNYLKDVAKKLEIEFEVLTSRIKGYEVEAKTHNSVAVAIATGKADVGVAIKTVAKQYDLDFIPLKSEEYDFLIPKDKINKDSVKKFVEILCSAEFAERLKSLEGLKTYEKTGKILEIL
ncbi:MAG: molybdopterin biosynthesis protein, partial [Archaeoglobales archaeon]|nr:molybdopterin biosynthesis protein [Archaeoglobales archaeon]